MFVPFRQACTRQEVGILTFILRRLLSLIRRAEDPIPYGFREKWLIVGKSQPPRTDLSSQNAVFLDEIFNDLPLPLIQPTSNGNDKKRKGIQTRSHPRSLSRTSADRPLPRK